MADTRVTINQQEIRVVTGGRAGVQGEPGAGIDPRTLIIWYGNSIVEAPLMTPAVETLQNTLNAVSDKYYVMNAGRSGETAAQIRARVESHVAAGIIPHIAIFGPDAVNSFRTGASTASVQADLQACYTALKGAGATVVVLTDTPWEDFVDANPTYSWDSGKQAKTDTLNTWKLSTATDVDVRLDAYTHFENGSDADQMAAAYDSGDHLHPNQAGQTELAALVYACSAWTEADTDPGVIVRGQTVALDQSLDTEASPSFAGLSVGADQGGFSGKPVFDAGHDGGAGTRGAAFGRRRGDDRTLDLDVVWRVRFLWDDGAICSDYGVPQRYWGGGGYGAISFDTANSGAKVERMLLQPDGKITIGRGNNTDIASDGVRLFSLCNGALERYETSAGSPHNGVADQIIHLARNFTSGAYIPNVIYAISHVWNIGTAPGASLTSAALTTWVPIVPDTTATRDIGTTSVRFNAGFLTNLTVTDLSLAARVRGWATGTGASARPGDFRNLSAGFTDTVLFVAHSNSTLGSANLIAGYDLNINTFRFVVADNGNVTNTNNSYGAISDRRVKKNITPAGSQWDDVKALSGCLKKYNLKSDPDGPKQLGAIAQDWEKISPGLVFEFDEMVMRDGEMVPTGRRLKGINYSVAQMKAFGALGEAQRRIEALEAAVARLADA